MIHRIAAILVVLLFSVQARAQTVQSVMTEAVPATATLQWDPAVLTSTDRVDGYRVLLDGTVVATVTGVLSASASFTVASFGRHVIGLKSFNAQFESPVRELTIDLAQKITLIVPPNGANLVLVITSATAGVPAPFSVGGKMWTLVGTDPQVDGKHAGNAGAAATQLILLPSGVYILATDLNWYKWTGTDWGASLGRLRPVS